MEPTKNLYANCVLHTVEYDVLDNFILNRAQNSLSASMILVLCS